MLFEEGCDLGLNRREPLGVLEEVDCGSAEVERLPQPRGTNIKWMSGDSAYRVAISALNL
jgi:hypothetical protein